MINPDQVWERVEAVLPDVLRLRHDLHQHPELALEERRTASIIRKVLDERGIRVLDPLLGTDVVGMLAGARPGRNVTLRADMDALPLLEKGAPAYRSVHEGLMHACGHDGHSAALAGAAMVLSELSAGLSGSVRFVFQPGEEVVAAGRDLVEAGVLTDPVPDLVYALHAWPGLPAGAIASKPGVFMAAAGFFTITVTGKGSHGSKPEQGVDPILTAARVIEGLQMIASRRVKALDSVVVSICRIAGGSNGNIIPDSVEMEGTIRYLKREMGEQIRSDLEQIVKGICESAGATYELCHSPSYVPTVNHPDAIGIARQVVGEMMGPDCWIEAEEPSMGGEDFAFYIQDYPGAMLWLGMGETSAPLHNACFDFNDAALRNAVAFLVSVAIAGLSEGGGDTQ